MIDPTARLADKSAHDRMRRGRVVDEASALFRVYGEGAIDIVSDGLIDSTKGAEERRHDRLVIVELERLDRVTRESYAPKALVVWKPPLFSFDRIKGFFDKLRGPPKS